MLNQYGLIEIDGPQRGYFEWVPATNFGIVERVRYKTIYIAGVDPVEVTKNLCAVIENVKALLSLQRAEVQVLWWRVRPSIESHYDDETGIETFVGRCRLATTPDLPREFWKQVEKPESQVSPLSLVPSANQEHQDETSHQAGNASDQADPSELTESGGPCSVPSASFDPSEAA